MEILLGMTTGLCVDDLINQVTAETQGERDKIETENLIKTFEYIEKNKK